MCLIQFFLKINVSDMFVEREKQNEFALEHRSYALHLYLACEMKQSTSWQCVSGIQWRYRIIFNVALWRCICVQGMRHLFHQERHLISRIIDSRDNKMFLLHKLLTATCILHDQLFECRGVVQHSQLRHNSLAKTFWSFIFIVSFPGNITHNTLKCIDHILPSQCKICYTCNFNISKLPLVPADVIQPGIWRSPAI